MKLEGTELLILMIQIEITKIPSQFVIVQSFSLNVKWVCSVLTKGTKMQLKINDSNIE